MSSLRKAIASFLQPPALIDGRFEYKKSNKLGEGAFGMVFKGKDKKTGEQVAIKSLKVDFSTYSSSGSDYHRDLEISENINHPNIVQLIDFVTSGKHAYLIFELCNEDLSSLIKRRRETSGKFSQYELNHLLRQIISGTAYLHSRETYLGDLKPSNILVKYNKQQSCSSILAITLKLADFDSARLAPKGDSNITLSVGTPVYMAPEVKVNTDGSNCTDKADCYSIGVIACELYHMKRPENKQADLKLKTDEIYSESKSYGDLIKVLTATNPDDRLHAEAIPSHKFFLLFDAPTRILVTGGWHRGTYLSDVEVVVIPSPHGNAEDGREFEIDNLPFPLSYHGLIDGKIIGGDMNFRTKSNQVFELQMKKANNNEQESINGKWKPLPSMERGRGGFAVIQDKDGATQVTGGMGTYDNDEEFRDGKWNRKGNLPFEVWGQTMHRLTDRGLDVIIGGYNNLNGIWSREIGVNEGKWEKKRQELKKGRMWHSSFVYKNSIYVVGGDYDDGRSTEIIDLKTFKIRKGPQLPMKYGFRGSIIKDRFERIFILGGNMEDSRIMEFRDGKFILLQGVKLKMAKIAVACIDLDTL